MTACQATRIRTAVDPIDPRLFRAVGVEYQTAQGVNYTAVAKNEVILSAGKPYYFSLVRDLIPSHQEL